MLSVNAKVMNFAIQSAFILLDLLARAPEL